jgi:hypothetical protein
MPVKAGAVLTHTPILDFQSLDSSKMRHVVCYNNQAIGHSYPGNEKVNVVDQLALLSQIGINIG